MTRMIPDELKPREGWMTMVAVAILGGLARQCHQLLMGRKVTWMHFFFRAGISFFIGTLCSYLFPIEKDTNHHSPWAFGACGLLAWLGADGIALMIQLCTNTVGSKMEDKIDEGKGDQ